MKLNRTITATLALSFTGIALAQTGIGIGKRPICNYAVEESWEQTENSGSGSSCTYTECLSSYQCVDGDMYKDCGTTSNDFWEVCANYVGGTWNNETQQCEGGSLQMPYVITTQIPGYPNPTPCDGGLN